jgi:glucan-binding YG repeat protein
MTNKKHFKLYKNGKKWCVMAIAALVGIVSMSATVNADTSVNVNNTEDTVSLAQVASSTTNNASQSDTEGSSNEVTLNNQATQSASLNNGNGSETNQAQENSSNNETNTESQYTNAKLASAASETQSKNGWIKENNQWVYYNNDQKLSGRSYSYLPTITSNGTGTGYNWYLVDNGVVQSGVQKWANTYYDFDSNTYLRVDNNYVRSQWGLWYLFGNDGRIQTGVQKWYGTYYYFDPSTYLRVDNDYRQSQWGLWYLFGNDGRIQTGVQKWAGTYYYFDPNTYLRVDNDYRQSQWGLWYLFGNDGRIQTGVHRWAGFVYYFDPITYLRVDNSWREGLYFGSDGKLQNGGFSTRVINWFLQREGRLTYSMYGSRTGADGTADCSGSMTMALRTAGASTPWSIYNTETLHGYLLNNGYYLAYEGQNGPASLQYGDVIIWGHKAASLGGNGHTMVATGSGDNPTVISTCYLTEGERGTAVQEVNYDWYWYDAEKPYQYVYRLANQSRN